MLALVPKMFDFFGMAALSQPDKEELLRAFYDDLELSVGHELAGGLSKRDLDDFEEIIRYLRGKRVDPENDPSIAWLDQVRPDYRDVVNRQLRRLLQILNDNSEWICGIAQVDRGPVSSDPVQQTLDFMQAEGQRIRLTRATYE